MEGRIFFDQLSCEQLPAAEKRLCILDVGSSLVYADRC